MNLAINNVQDICELLIQYNYTLYEVNIDQICGKLGVISASGYISTHNFIFYRIVTRHREIRHMCTQNIYNSRMEVKGKNLCPANMFTQINNGLQCTNNGVQIQDVRGLDLI